MSSPISGRANTAIDRRQAGGTGNSVPSASCPLLDNVFLGWNKTNFQEKAVARHNKKHSDAKTENAFSKAKKASKK